MLRRYYLYPKAEEGPLSMNRTFRHPETGEERPEQRRSGNGTLTYKWLVPILLGLLSLGGGGWVATIHAQVSGQSDRLARVETAVLRLPRIEDKLDRLLELR